MIFHKQCYNRRVLSRLWSDALSRLYGKHPKDQNYTIVFLIEGVSVPAAPLNILGFAIGSLEEIRGTISAVRDGPQQISQLADAVVQLQGVLGSVISIPSELMSWI